MLIPSLLLPRHGSCATRLEEGECQAPPPMTIRVRVVTGFGATFACLMLRQRRCIPLIPSTSAN